MLLFAQKQELEGKSPNICRWMMKKNGDSAVKTVMDKYQQVILGAPFSSIHLC